MSLPRVTLTEDTYGVRSLSPHTVVDLPAGTAAIDTGVVWHDPLTDEMHHGYRTLIVDLDDGRGAVVTPSMPGFFTTEETT